MHIVCSYIKHTYAVKQKMTTIPQTAALSKNVVHLPMCSGTIPAPGLPPGARTTLNAMLIIPLYV